MIKTSLAAAALAMATLGAATTPASAATSITVQIGPPPAPYYEAVPTPRRGQVWLPGHWEWRGTWVWVPGHYVAVNNPQAVWVPGEWDPAVDGTWRWNPAHWAVQ